jgi:peptidoglycan/LPS O-acetylase OafA/YrhL
MPGLDIVRGIAIAMVIVYHASTDFDWLFYIHHTPLALSIQFVLHLGTFGVHLFFILSGFLITGILLDSRDKSDYFRNFYLRRILRIVPAYLAVLLVLVFTHNISVRYFAVCLIYFCNMTGIFGINAEYGPLWSLSVEEQFYLVWPVVVRKCSRRTLAWFSLGLVLGSPLLRLALLYGPHAVHDIYYKTWAVLDFFAAGSLLAISVRHSFSTQRLTQASTLLLFGGALLFVLQKVIPGPNQVFLQNVLQTIWLEPLLFFFTGLTLLAYSKPQLGSITALKPLIFLAKISYGLYLYHMVIFDLTIRHWPAKLTASMGPVSLAFLKFFVQLTLSIIIAALSRYTLEEYFLRRKPQHSRTSRRHSAAGEIA